MSDLISRQAAIDAFRKELTTGEQKGKYVTISSAITYLGAKQILEKLPSAQPEIVRCKDCTFYDGRPCGIVDWWNTADDFCSKAERRPDE